MRMWITQFLRRFFFSTLVCVIFVSTLFFGTDEMRRNNALNLPNPFGLRMFSSLDFSHKTGIVDPGKQAISQTTIENHTQCKKKSFSIGQFAIIEPPYLLCDVTKKMKRSDTDICSVNTSLQERPEIFDTVATRIRWSINQAVRCVTPIARLSSWLLIPFLQLATAQIATNHLSSPRGESSKIVPTLELNCLRQSLHRNNLRVLTSPIRTLPHSVQTGRLFPHFISRMSFSQTSKSAK